MHITEKGIQQRLASCKKKCEGMDHDRNAIDNLSDNLSETMLLERCPLHPNRVRSINWHFMDELKRIDDHLEANDCCKQEHPPLKDLVLVESLEGANPLIQAVREGGLKAVNHMVENWGRM